MTEKLVEEIRRRLPITELRENEPLAAYTSLRIGGPAALMLFPKSAGEIAALCLIMAAVGERPLMLGNGSNVLAPDEGLDRAVIVTSRVISCSVDGEQIAAECGASLTKLAAAAAAEGLSGLEFAYGIPGTVGGALVMNAGAYGGEMKDVVIKTDYLRICDDNIDIFSVEGEEHGFSYRASRFGPEDVILKTRMRLKEGRPEEIRKKMKDLMSRRRASQPLELPSAGSAFKRPAGGYAAELIERAGLKGFSVGGAKVSEKHAGFIVNSGGARSGDVLRLMEHIRETVLARFGVELQPEIKILS